MSATYYRPTHRATVIGEAPEQSRAHCEGFGSPTTCPSCAPEIYAADHSRHRDTTGDPFPRERA